MTDQPHWQVLPADVREWLEAREVVNGVRVFLTGFLVYFVSPALGTGFMHVTEGWLLFLVSLASLGFVAFVTSALERRIHAWRHPEVFTNA